MSPALNTTSDLRCDQGADLCQVIAPLTTRSGAIAVALRGMDVPVLLDASGAILGVTSGNLHTHVMTGGQEIVWRWRA